MDVSHWSADKIMQLPDAAFGRRWMIGMSADTLDANVHFDLADLSLPDKIVIWEVQFPVFGGLSTTADIVLSLGSTLPSTDAEFLALERVFLGVSTRDGIKGGVESLAVSHIALRKMRQMVVTGGRTFVARFKRALSTAGAAACIVTISSFPREVPDFYLGHSSRQLDEMIRLLRIGANLPAEKPDVSDSR